LLRATGAPSGSRCFCRLAATIEFDDEIREDAAMRSTYLSRPFVAAFGGASGLTPWVEGQATNAAGPSRRKLLPSGGVDLPRQASAHKIVVLRVINRFRRSGPLSAANDVCIAATFSRFSDQLLPSRGIHF